jgi:hypothetical protein
MNESQIPIPDEPQPPTRSPVVHRLARFLTIGLFASLPLFFAAACLGPVGLIVYAIYFVSLSVVAVLTFFGAVFTGDIPIAFATLFALAIIGVVWLGIWRASMPPY